MFSGVSSSRRKVDLRGRSRKEDTHKEVLEKARLEREKRKRQKEENKAATAIQALWRGQHFVALARDAVRQRWIERYSVFGENAVRDDLHPSSPHLRELLFFCSPASLEDLQRLAAACRLLLSSRDAQGRLSFCDLSELDRHDARATVIRAQRLVQLALEGLTLHRERFAAQLALPRVAAAEESREVVPPLVDAVLRLTGAQEWQPGFVSAGGAVGAILRRAVQNDLLGQVSKLLPVACPPLPASARGRAAPVASAEALTTALVVRSLQAPAAQPEVGRALPHLLCVPLVWRRCRTLGGAADRLWPVVVHSLAPLSLHALIAWLPGDLPGGKAAAAAALLGNLVEVAGQALGGDDASAASRGKLATAFTQLLRQLLSLLPLAPVFGTAFVAAADEDEDAPPSTSAAAGGVVLPWQGPPPSPAWVAQLHGVADARMLAVVCRTVLPATWPPGSGAGQQGGGGCPPPPSPELAGAVRSLCLLLEALLSLGGQAQRLLISLAVPVQLVQRLWYSFLRAAQAAGGDAWVPSGDDSLDPGWMLPLTLLSRAYSAFIVTAGAEELHARQRPLPLTELYDAAAPGAGLIAMLKWALWQALWVETPPVPGGWPAPAAALRAGMKAAVGGLLGQLYGLNSRRAFAPVAAFHADHLATDRFHAELQLSGSSSSMSGKEAAGSGRAWAVLRSAPFLVPFQERAFVFQSLVTADRQAHREMDFAMGMGAHGHAFTVVRRNAVLEDGFTHLNHMGPGLKARVRIQFVNEYGVEEAGVDGGGIFKEFLETIVKEGFDPRVGLFKASPELRLYPNPPAFRLVPSAASYYEFLGRMLGKAMYEGILLELPLAPFFLKKFRSAHCDINDLPGLDSELYRHLMGLKDYGGDVGELGLYFTVVDTSLGDAREVELLPGGRDTPVTRDNVLGYMHRVAHHRLNVQPAPAAAAFLRGLHDLVPPQWLRMFNEDELQMLISGAQEGLDVADMRAHVQYSGGYHDQHPVIRELWKVLDGFSPEEQRGFLKFVTSCSRAPLLGFRYLEPQLCVQMAGSVLDPTSTDRLPTAATCMNLLKLPPYLTAGVIREKLLYAIAEGAGFELS